MYHPISNPHQLQAFEQPTWQGTARSYLLLPLLPVLLWALSDPLYGLFTLTVGTSLALSRRASVRNDA